MDFQVRQKALQNHLTTSRFDALLVRHLPNLRYLCGFTGSAGLLLVEQSRTVFFTDVRYDIQARQEVKADKVIIARKSVLEALADWWRKRHQRRPCVVGLESEHFTIADKKRMIKLRPSAVKFKDAPSIVERFRMVKDAKEVQCIRDAVKLGARVFDRALEVLRPGIKEAELAAEMEYSARTGGAEGMSFGTIVASGARSALPHGRASDRTVPSGAFVVFDFGVILEGYCSDETRSVWVGDSPGEAKRIYECVLEAQLSAIAAVRPGVPISNADKAARTVLEKAKLGRYFTHSISHGVGLELHERPYSRTSGQEEILRPGMVITIEPGVYFPGKWGIRIEDMVVVTAGGCEVLTPTSKEFLAV